MPPHPIKITDMTTDTYILNFQEYFSEYINKNISNTYLTRNLYFFLPVRKCKLLISRQSLFPRDMYTHVIQNVDQT